jgi:hypothetical protein
MKINILSVFFICSILIVSCGEKKNKSVSISENSASETPEILVNPESESGRKVDFFSSDSRGYESDIINKLYDEALEKNEALQSLHDRILMMPSIKSDTLSAFNQYESNNAKYWESVNAHLAQIQDTVLRATTRQVFEQLETSYNGKISGHLATKQRIKKRADELNDRLVLMKLFVTKVMMENYQNNELPKVKNMEALIKDYDKLIREMKEMTK